MIWLRASRGSPGYSPDFRCDAQRYGSFPNFSNGDVRRGSRDIGIAVTEGTCSGRSFGCHGS